MVTTFINEQVVELVPFCCWCRVVMSPSTWHTLSSSPTSLLLTDRQNDLDFDTEYKKSTTGLTFYQHCTFLQLANKPVVGNLVFTALLIDWWYDWQRRKKLSHAFHSIWYAVHPTKQFNVNQCSSGNFKMKEWMNDVTMIAPSSRHSTDI